MNPLFATDSYKQSHCQQYPEGTEMVYSNLTPRSTKYAPKADGADDKVVSIGIQFFIKEFLVERFNRDFFGRPKKEVIAEYERIMCAHLGSDGVGVDKIAALHDLGYLPICIRALPEGSVVKAGVPVMTIYNVLPEFYWLTNYLETVLADYTWKASTSATTARKYKQIALKYAAPEERAAVDVQGHDFSFRGMTFIDDAAQSGMGHLLNFIGTDTIAAIPYIEKYYNSKIGEDFTALSVPATEHSVQSLRADYSGEEPDELESIRELIEDIYPENIISIVADTFDFWNMITVNARTLKPKILARTGEAPFPRVVFRPDSGNPVDVLCGKAKEVKVLTENSVSVAAFEGFTYVKNKGKFFQIINKYPVSNSVSWREVTEELTEQEEAELNGAVETLWNIFGGTVNSEGNRLMDSHVGLIYGDSITLERAEIIFRRLKAKGFSTLNVVLGIGSFTYQCVTRDTYGYAVKATAGIVYGDEKFIYKAPKTDTGGFKKSARGFLAVRKDENGEYYLVDELSFKESEKNTELELTFFNGELRRDENFAEIRERYQKTL